MGSLNLYGSVSLNLKRVNKFSLFKLRVYVFSLRTQVRHWLKTQKIAKIGRGLLISSTFPAEKFLEREPKKKNARPEIYFAIYFEVR